MIHSRWKNGYFLPYHSDGDKLAIDFDSYEGISRGYNLTDGNKKSVFRCICGYAFWGINLCVNWVLILHSEIKISTDHFQIPLHIRPIHAIRLDTDAPSERVYDIRGAQ